MCRICKILVLFSNQQAKQARERISKLASLELTLNAVQVSRTPICQEELCIELHFDNHITDEEAEEAVLKIWKNTICVTLKEFEHDDVQITI